MSHSRVSKLRMVSLIWVLLLVGLSIYSYVIGLGRLDRFLKSFDLIYRFNSRTILVSQMIDKVLDRLATDSEIYSDGSPLEDQKLALKNKLQEIIEEIQGFSQELQSKKFHE